MAITTSTFDHDVTGTEDRDLAGLAAGAGPDQAGGRAGPPVADADGRPSPPHGYTPRKDAHMKRLRRIEGQVRGLQRMLEEDKYCIDILTQVSAATRALQAFSLEMLDEHLNHCVLHAAEHGGAEAEAKIAEASAAIARLVRS